MSVDTSRSAETPEERAVSGHPDMPPQQQDHRKENDRELLDNGGKKDSDGGEKERKEMPGTTLPGYG